MFERNVRRFSVAFITLLDELQIRLKNNQNILFFDGNLHENLSKNVQVTEIQHSKLVLKKSFQFKNKKNHFFTSVTLLSTKISKNKDLVQAF